MMARLNLKTALTAVPLIVSILLVSEYGSLFPSNSPLAAENKSGRKITVNALTFSIPKGYGVMPGNEPENSIFLFNKKYNEGLFISVPSPPFDLPKLLQNNTETALTKFFPKGPQTYDWKPLTDRRIISKFEIGASKAMGFNQTNLVIMQVHHFLFAGRHIFIGDIFKWTHGDNKEIFARGLGGDSMQGCNDLVEVVYSITGEKIDETNSPCELIALPPDD
jgi:hypothetical protein